MKSSRRRKIVFLSLFLFGCNASSPWSVSYLPGAEKEFDSARLIYPAYDKINGITAEMIYTKNNLRTYLTVHSQAIPPYQGNPREALVTLKTPHKTIRTRVPRHEGGQRVFLPSDLQKILTETLLSGHPVILELQGYSTQLSPEQFATAYSNLKQKPLNLPFQLPFRL